MNLASPVCFPLLYLVLKVGLDEGFCVQEWSILGWTNGGKFGRFDIPKEGYTIDILDCVGKIFL